MTCRLLPPDPLPVPRLSHLGCALILFAAAAAVAVLNKLFDGRDVLTAVYLYFFGG